MYRPTASSTVQSVSAGTSTMGSVVTLRRIAPTIARDEANCIPDAPRRSRGRELDAAGLPAREDGDRSCGLARRLARDVHDDRTDRRRRQERAAAASVDREERR